MNDGGQDSALSIKAGEEDIFVLLKAALMQSKPPTVILDDQERCVYLNQAFVRLSGFAQKEIAGRPLQEVLETYGAGEEVVAPHPSLVEGEGITTAGVLKRKDGALHPVVYSVQEVASQGRLIGRVIRLQDSDEITSAAEALKRSEERFRTLVTTHAAVVWRAERDGSLVEAPLWEQFTGQPFENARGWGWLDYVHPDDRPLITDSWNSAVSRKTASQLEYRLRHDDGGYRYVLDRFAPILDERNEPQEWVGTITDIHDRRQAEEASGRLAAIVASSDDAIISKNLDGIIASWNRSAEKIFGWTSSEAVGRHISLIIPPDRLSEEDLIISRLRRGEAIEHYETVRQRKDGTTLEISLSISPVIDSRGRIVGASKVARDITERKRAEADLLVQTRTLEIMYEVATSLAADLDLQRLAQVVIDAGTKISGAEHGIFRYGGTGDGYERRSFTASGRSVEESLVAMGLDRDDVELIFDPDRVTRIDDLSLDRGLESNPIASGVAESRTVRSYLSVPLVSRSGEVLGGLFFGHSEPGVFSAKHESTIVALASHASTAMDNARLYEQAVKLNESLESKVRQRTSELQNLNAELESFNYSVSHDLRAPLRSIDGFSHVLLEDYGSSLDDTARQYLQRIRLGTSRMGKLIDDLLKLSSLTRTPIRPRELDLSALVNEIGAELREREPEREVELVVCEGMKAFGDPALLRIVMENLLGNAWKFTQNSEQARVEVGAAESSRIRSAPQQVNAQAFYVRDNGVGFSMSYANKLFTPFQRLHNREDFDGTGIGLATVQRIIHRHGGQIWADSEPGAGASFYFTTMAVGAQGGRPVIAR